MAAIDLKTDRKIKKKFFLEIANVNYQLIRMIIGWAALKYNSQEPEM